jgi:hypothetical protein
VRFYQQEPRGGSAPAADGQNIRAGGIFVPPGGQDFRALGLGGGEVVLFGAVRDGVVQAPGLVGEGDEFPRAIEDGAVAFMLPENGLGPANRFAGKRRKQADAFERGKRLAVEFFRVTCARDGQAGGHDVNEVAGLVFEFAVA